MHDFTGSGTDGAYPYSNLIADSNDNFYGTTTNGGANGHGIVYEITLQAQATQEPGREIPACAALRPNELNSIVPIGEGRRDNEDDPILFNFQAG
jgi:uncharacterized repeat protein (TIGR03803 family)